MIIDAFFFGLFVFQIWRLMNLILRMRTYSSLIVRGMSCVLRNYSPLSLEPCEDIKLKSK